MRMRKKVNLPARMERCAQYLIQAPEEYRGHWRDLKPDAAELRLELGCGKGRFTAETAAANPDVLYIALERVPDAMIIAMERVQEKGLNNVFFIDGDAAQLREYFAPDEVDLLYINFCDPWPSHKGGRCRKAIFTATSCTMIWTASSGTSGRHTARTRLPPTRSPRWMM